LALEGGKWSASCPPRLPFSGERPAGSYKIERFLGYSNILDAAKKILSLCWNGKCFLGRLFCSLFTISTEL